MYEFVVAGMFKNEEHAIIEWIEHYLFHGAEHIYLINDGSTDKGVEKIQPYINDGRITLFDSSNWGKYLGRQRDIYNHFLLHMLNDKVFKWLLICDLDEFIWSPISVDLKIPLRNCGHLSQMQIGNSLFGSSGFIEQPSCIVKNFIKREKDRIGLRKYFVNSDYKFSYLNIHHASYVNEEDSKGTFIYIVDDYFIFNHYRIQSFEFWKNVKCTRGDSNKFAERTIDDFYDWDKNEIEDLGLWEQNKHMDFYKNM